VRHELARVIGNQPARFADPDAGCFSADHPGADDRMALGKGDRSREALVYVLASNFRLLSLSEGAWYLDGAMRIPLVVPPNPLTPEQYAKSLGISRRRFLELKAIAEKALADVAARGATGLGLTVPEFFEYIRKPDSTLDLASLQRQPNGSPRKRTRHASKRN
jgi:hypothetical protein